MFYFLLPLGGHQWTTLHYSSLSHSLANSLFLPFNIEGQTEKAKDTKSDAKGQPWSTFQCCG